MHILSDKFERITTDYPDLENRLKKLTEFRNRCAHSFPDTSDDYLAKKNIDKISLVWYEDGIRKHQDVTYAEAQTKIQEFVQTFLDMEAIREKIGRFSPP